MGFGVGRTLTCDDTNVLLPPVVLAVIVTLDLCPFLLSLRALVALLFFGVCIASFERSIPFPMA